MNGFLLGQENGGGDGEGVHEEWTLKSNKDKNNKFMFYFQENQQHKFSTCTDKMSLFVVFKFLEFSAIVVSK